MPIGYTPTTSNNSLYHTLSKPGMPNEIGMMQEGEIATTPNRQQVLLKRQVPTPESREQDDATPEYADFVAPARSPGSDIAYGHKQSQRQHQARLFFQGRYAEAALLCLLFIALFNIETLSRYQRNVMKQEPLLPLNTSSERHLSMLPPPVRSATKKSSSTSPLFQKYLDKKQPRGDQRHGRSKHDTALKQQRQQQVSRLVVRNQTQKPNVKDGNVGDKESLSVAASPEISDKHPTESAAKTQELPPKPQRNKANPVAPQQMTKQEKSTTKKVDTSSKKKTQIQKPSPKINSDNNKKRNPEDKQEPKNMNTPKSASSSKIVEQENARQPEKKKSQEKSPKTTDKGNEPKKPNTSPDANNNIKTTPPKPKKPRNNANDQVMDAGPIVEWLYYPPKPNPIVAPMDDEGDENKKCTPWDVNVDDWWQDHPEWDVAEENATHACFRKFTNPDRVEFLKTIHKLQNPDDIETGCPRTGKKELQMAFRHLPNVGFRAAVHRYIHRAFWGAYREGRPFQVGKPKKTERWLYVPPYDDKGNATNSWAACPTQDLECFFLPVSNCPRPVGGKDAMCKKKYCDHELYGMGKNKPDPFVKQQNLWLYFYLLRPKQELRRHLYNYMLTAHPPTIPTPCTWVHVRRSDAMTENGYDRNFYSMEEYIKLGKIAKGSSVFLLTDDEAAIDEAELLYPEYTWSHWNRTRNRGPAQNNAHIPSKDEALELMIILAEAKLAGQCSKGVAGGSNMAKIFTFASALQHGFENFSLIDFGKKKLNDFERQDPEAFTTELERKIEAARAKRKLNAKR